MPFSSATGAQAQPLTKEVVRGGLLIALLFLLGYGWMVPDSLLHADAAEYLDDIRQLNEVSHPVHIGYILTTGGIIHSLGALSDPDWLINWVNLCWGAISLFALYLIAFHLTGKQSVSTVASLVLAVNFTFVFNSVFAEVYIMQVGCLLLALLFHLRERFVFSALLFALATLTTPLSLLALPLFACVQLRWKPMLMLGGTTALVLGAVLLLNDEYLNSGRFIMAMNENLKITRQAMTEVNEISNGFFVLTPALIAGCFILFRTPHLRGFNAGLALTFLVNFFLGERYYDVPGQLFVYCLLSIAAAAGLAVLLSRTDGKLLQGRAFAWSGTLAVASGLGAILTGWSIRLQQNMTDIPSFYLKAGLIVGGAWLLFTATSYFTPENRGVLRQFTAVLLVGLLLAFNWRFTYNRCRENKGLADAKKAELMAAANLCPECGLLATWNDAVLFRHYLWTGFGLSEKVIEHAPVQVLPESFNASYLQSAEALPVKEWVTHGRPVIMPAGLDLLSRFLAESGYKLKTLPGWELWKPHSSLQP